MIYKHACICEAILSNEKDYLNKHLLPHIPVTTEISLNH